MLIRKNILVSFLILLSFNSVVNKCRAVEIKLENNCGKNLTQLLIYKKLYIRNESGYNNKYSIFIYSAKDSINPAYKYCLTGGEYFYVNNIDPMFIFSKVIILSSFDGLNLEQDSLLINKCKDRSSYSNDYIWYEFTQTKDSSEFYLNEITSLVIHDDDINSKMRYPEFPVESIPHAESDKIYRLYINNESANYNSYNLYVVTYKNNYTLRDIDSPVKFYFDLSFGEEIKYILIESSYYDRAANTIKLEPYKNVFRNTDYSDKVWFELTKTDDNPPLKDNKQKSKDNKGPDRFVMNVIIHED